MRNPFKQLYVVDDGDRYAPANIDVAPGSGVVYVNAQFRTREHDDTPVALCYSRKQALALAWYLIVVTIGSFRRFR